MKDIELIIAHLLGGTSGLNLSKHMTYEEIHVMVSAAMRVAKEIKKQAKALRRGGDINERK